MKNSISIVTPSYNQGEFIERTIISVLDQNIDGLEFIVMDGSSTDNTLAILEKYNSKLSYVSEKDEGQTDAVNKGILKAKGEIIGWLNSDDVYYPDALRTVLEVFDNNPNIDVVYGLADHIDESDNYMEDYYTEEWDFNRLKEVCYLCQPAVFFRKSIVDKFGLLNKDLRYCMDYEYWLRIGQEKPFYFIDKKLAGSRLYSTNKTLGNRRAVHEEIILMLKNKFKEAPKRWIYNLAHVILEDAGYSRETPLKNYIFVKKLIPTALSSFVKFQNKLPVNECIEMLGWYHQARKQMLEAKNK